MKIYVSALTTVRQAVIDFAPSSIISFVDQLSAKPFFLHYDKNTHLALEFNDIHLNINHINDTQRIACARLIQFLTNHRAHSPLLIHCTLGISRSTAAAYIALNLHHQNQEFETAQYLREKIPYAIPNSSLIAIADTLLGRNGRMQSAISLLSEPKMQEVGGCKMLSTDFL